MTDFLSAEEREKIDGVLRKLFEDNPTYGEFMNALIANTELNEREKTIAAFVAGETTCRLTLTNKISQVLTGEE